MRHVEYQIANRLLDAVLAAGLTVSVNDGEETTLHKSKDKAALLAAMNTTEADTLLIYDNGVRMGYVWLVYGNGCDLLSDWADNERINALIEPTTTCPHCARELEGEELSTGVCSSDDCLRHEGEAA